MTDDTRPTAGDEPAPAAPPAHLTPTEPQRPRTPDLAPGSHADADLPTSTDPGEDLPVEEVASSEGATPAAPSEPTPVDSSSPAAPEPAPTPAAPEPAPTPAAPEPATGAIDPAAAPTTQIAVPPVVEPVPATIVAPVARESDVQAQAPAEPAPSVDLRATPALHVPPADTYTRPEGLAPPAAPAIDGGGNWEEPAWVDRGADEPVGLAVGHLEDEDEDADAITYGAGAQRPPTNTRNLAVIVLAAVTAIAVGFAAAFGLMLSDEHTLNSRRASALVEARAFAHDVTTYDYRHLDDDFKKVLTHAAGKFLTDFGDATKASGQFVTLVKQLKATASGDVIAAGLESGSSKKAEVVVIVSQTVQNTNRPVAQAQRTEGRVDLQWIGGKWKVVDFHVL